jgi:hypothetical protein
VVGDLEDVHRRQAARNKHRVDLLLDVAGQQKSFAGGLAEQHDRHVVDARAGIRWLIRNGVGVWPEDTQMGVVDGDPITSRQSARHETACGRRRRPGAVARTWTTHARLVDVGDLVARQEETQAGDVVLVRVRQDQGIDASVPGRQPLVERDEESVRIGAAIDKESAPAGTLDQNRVALPDIQYDDPGPAVRSVERDSDAADDRCDQRQDSDSLEPAAETSFGGARSGP